MSEGIVVQVIGAVIDVEFSRENLPKVYDALVIEESDLVLEVQQQLGDGVVRTIAMGQTEGLKRGAKAKNTGDAVSVPVGEKTLGRILNVLGDPIDGKGEVGEEEHQKLPDRSLVTLTKALNATRRRRVDANSMRSGTPGRWGESGGNIKVSAQAARVRGSLPRTGCGQPL